MSMPVYRSPHLAQISAIVLAWLTEPRHQPLAPQVAAWDDADWATARWVVQVHGIAALLDRAAASWPDAEMLAPALRNYLRAQRRLSSERVALLLRDMAELLAACHAAGVIAMPLKGSLLATQHYPEPGLRPMNDLDLLVRAEDERRVLALLDAQGYKILARSWKHIELARPEAHGLTVAFDGEHPDNPRSLDLHTRLVEQFWGIRYELTGAAWAQAQPGELLGQPAWLMPPALLLHHLAMHTSADIIARRVRLLHLYDIALVAPALDSGAWRQIVAHARAQREERFIYPALALASRYFAGVPQSVLADLRSATPPALLRHLAGDGLERFSFCNVAPTTLHERLCWFRPGRERAVALRHMLLPDPSELAIWYPRLAGPALLPLAYARYGTQIAGYCARRVLRRPRLKFFTPERQGGAAK